MSRSLLPVPWKLSFLETPTGFLQRSLRSSCVCSSDSQWRISPVISSPPWSFCLWMAKGCCISQAGRAAVRVLRLLTPWRAEARASLLALHTVYPLSLHMGLAKGEAVSRISVQCTPRPPLVLAHTSPWPLPPTWALLPPRKDRMDPLTGFLVLLCLRQRVHGYQRIMLVKLTPGRPWLSPHFQPLRMSWAGS